MNFIRSNKYTEIINNYNTSTKEDGSQIDGKRVLANSMGNLSARLKSDDDEQTDAYKSLLRTIEIASAVTLKTAADIAPKTAENNNRIKVPTLKRSATFADSIKRPKNNIVLKLSKYEKYQRQQQQQQLSESLSITKPLVKSDIEKTQFYLERKSSAKNENYDLSSTSSEIARGDIHEEASTNTDYFEPRVIEPRLKTAKKLSSPLGRSLSNLPSANNTKYVIFSNNNNNTSLSMPTGGSVLLNSKTGAHYSLSNSDETNISLINKHQSITPILGRSFSSYSIDVNNCKSIVGETRHLFDNIRVSGRRVSMREQSSRMPKITFELTSSRYNEAHSLLNVRIKVYCQS
jgi:hypothetical protein